MTTPTLTGFAEGQLCTADPFGRHGAVRHETPASPSEGARQSLGTALRD